MFGDSQRLFRLIAVTSKFTSPCIIYRAFSNRPIFPPETQATTPVLDKSENTSFTDNQGKKAISLYVSQW